ncbi:UNVERIFIED_CONTAM: Spore coat assembly protein [Acetivibrio alkalicellulosi]
MKNERNKKIFFLFTVTGVLIMTLLLLFIVDNFNSNNIETASNYLSVDNINYPNTLFDNSYIHTIDIYVDKQAWTYMIKNAEKKKYIPCKMVIDGVEIDQVGIRPKGNSSLKQIGGMNSENFSFKVEFDRYINQTFDGLDKLALNNFTQDPTHMKDYLTQQMMNYIGIPAPLTSFVNITLNGEPFGFYLAVEAVEDSFSLRNYGNNDGTLYKPDSLQMANFDFSALATYTMSDGQTTVEFISDIMSGKAYKDADQNTRIDALGDFAAVLLEASNISTDVSGLVYIDDNPKSYNAIFDQAIFNATQRDKKRLINSIKMINNGENLDDVIDIESVIKYFVVHNFVVNYDGYTSIFSHNYYLHEKDGKLSMIPWDYNLAFGCLTFDAAKSVMDLLKDYIILDGISYGMSTDKSMVNYPIASPNFTVTLEERPLIYQVLNNKEYYDLYHKYFDEFISDYFESGYFNDFYSKTIDMISPYVKNDVKGFFTYNQFENGAKELKKFCNLRSKSIRGQLNGTIPSTLTGQNENPESLIDVGDLDIIKTIDFSTMITMLGISVEDIDEVLKAVIKHIPNKYLTDGKINISKLEIAGIDSLKENIDVIASIAFNVIKDNHIVRKKVITMITPFILLVLSLLLIIVFTIVLNKYSRVKHKTNMHRKYEEG